MKEFLQFEPIQRFVSVLGKDIEKYVGKDRVAVVYLKPDGVWYAQGIAQWLKKRKKNVTVTTMEDDGEGLEEEKIRGRKVLLVDNDVVSGKGYKRSMEALRLRKARLNLKEIRFATYADRPGLADFAVERYSAESVWRLADLDAVGLKIIKLLAQNGREAFADIGKTVNLSAVAIKHRVDRLIEAKVLKVQAQLSVEQFYSLSAHILLEADEKTVNELIDRFSKIQEVYHIAKLSTSFSLCLDILSSSLSEIELFVERELRSRQGVKQIKVWVGGIPIVPKTIPPKF